MIRNRILQVLLSPLLLLYGSVVALRNWLYNTNMLKSIRFSIPIINVGNLSVGGSGKTPHVEYLITLLAPYINVATMSRGYKRKSRGYRLIERRDDAETAGDEPLLYKRKYPDVAVSVSESRALGIPKLLQQAPHTKVLLLDDAFQHREVRPGLNILLTPYDNPFYEDYLLPIGKLREWRSAYKRADIIIVSKCPESLSEQEKDQMLKSIEPGHREVFFTRYVHGQPYYLFNGKTKLDLEKVSDILLVSGIANPDYLKKNFEDKGTNFYSLDFPDHHSYSNYDIGQIQKAFEGLDSKASVILTTEKDAVKLEKHRAHILQHNLPVFVLPVRVVFLFGGKDAFDQRIKNFLLDFKV